MKQRKSEDSAESTMRHKSKLTNCDKARNHYWKKVWSTKNM